VLEKFEAKKSTWAISDQNFWAKKMAHMKSTH
jgi:hypothetical protein